LPEPSSTPEYTAAVVYLDSLAQFGWKLDLERIQRLCELAGHPERRFRSILVGGSAGKGSTCTFLAAILRAAGLRVGTAPKPHLLTHRERAQVNGELIPEERFATLMDGIRPWVEQVTVELGSPTVFEVMTLLAFLHFAESRVDWAVVEVGLGGRFDATNILTPELAVITTIGLDHTDRLGDTVEQIAFEKAGIIKPGGRVLTGASGPALDVIRAAAEERGADYRALGAGVELDNIRLRENGSLFDLLTPEGCWGDLSITMSGAHQAHNAALAAAAAFWLRAEERVRIEDEALRAGLAQAWIAGRLQVVRREPLVLLDGAHSPDRALALADAVRTLYLDGQPERRVLLVIGCSAGHAPETVVAHLAPLADEIIATRSRHPAAIPVAEVAAAARAAGKPAVELEPVAAALESALSRARPQDLVLVTGSLFAVGEALAALQE
jgi:dihydrofolate synthase/folylpolyglutamate synthase